MKKIMVIGLIVTLSLLLTTAVFAAWGGCGMSSGASANIESIKKFQKETLSLRDDLFTKRLELQKEAGKPESDTARITALRKEVIDLQGKIQEAADKYGLPAWDSMGGMMGHGMMGPMMGGGMMGRGMMMGAQ